MSAITYLNKLRFEKSKAIVLVQFPHETTGMDMFAYLKLDKEGYDKLVRAHENGDTGRFSDYGEVILFGKGEPNQETKDFIKNMEL